MKTIIAGSRNCYNYNALLEAISQCGWTPSIIISGSARGVDKLGEKYAKLNDKQLICFPAQWDKYGKKAGYLRNNDMVKKADALIALWDGKSNGTAHMISKARENNLLIYIKLVN